MGACSSKPKTKDSDGSLEPQKPTDFTPDQPQHAERSFDNFASELEKDALIKREEGEVAPGLVAGQDEQPSKVLPSRSKEENVTTENEPVDNAAVKEGHQIERDTEGASDEAVRKDDEIEITSNANENQGQGPSLVDEAKTCEDKGVVSEAISGSKANGAPLDKTVAVNEERSPDIVGKRKIVLPEEQAMDSAECADVESPITGVVKPVAPITGVVKPLASTSETADKNSNMENVAIDPAKDTAFEGSYTDTDAMMKIPAGPGSEDLDLNDVKTKVLEQSGVVSEARGEEKPPAATSIEPICPPMQPDLSKDNQVEEESHSEEADGVINASLHSMNSAGKIEERSTDAKVDTHSKEGAAERHKSDVNKPRNESNADSLMAEVSKADENADSDGPVIEPVTKGLPAEIINGKNELLVERKDARNGQIQTSDENVDGNGSSIFMVTSKEEKV